MALTEMSAIGDRLLIYELFGGKVDRRQRCDGVPGGAWIIDPGSGQLAMNLEPTLYFWRLIPSSDGTSLYGVAFEAPVLGAPAQLVHLDAHSGETLKTQPLEGDYWWIAAASLRSIPAGSRSLLLPVDRAY